MITRAFRSPWLLAGAVAAVFAMACNSADTTALLKPTVASYRSDSTCADSMLSFSRLNDSVPVVAEGAAYSTQIAVSTSGADACYTSALATADPTPQPVYVDSTEPSGRFLVGGPEEAIVTGYYHAGDTPGWGYYGMTVSNLTLFHSKFFIFSP